MAISICLPQDSGAIIEMKINKLSITNMYGSYTRAINFRKDINLLVGINGSGKTTILNCIDWMLRPDFASLAATSFDEVSIEFTFKSKPYVVVATQGKERMTIRETRSGHFPDSIAIDFIQHPSSLTYEHQYQFVKEQYKRLGPDRSERKLWTFLSELTHPLTVSLDRSISAETEDDVFIEHIPSPRAGKDRKLKSPLEKVKDVTRDRYARYRSQVYDLNERLKTKLVISAFRSPVFRPVPTSKSQASRKVSLQEISNLERRVTNLLAASLGGDEALSHIQNYFSGAKQFAEHAQHDQTLLEVFRSQYRQIDELTQAFDDYEKQASSAYESLGSYLKSVNSFFVDSNKRILFNETDGNLAFQFMSDPHRIARFRPLERLSSGERQILILITFLAFVSSSSQVFVVDEPELSLHPKWQSNFLDAIVSQAPENTQIIMATHSPEIVGRHREYCVVLGG